MQVRVLPFGVLKDWLGFSTAVVDMPEGATVTELLERLTAAQLAGRPANPLGGKPSQALRGIAVSVNAEYAVPAQVLREGDEIGLLPPVSGGAAREADPHDENSRDEAVLIAITRAPIEPEKLIAAAKQGEDGAVVVFDGIVRNNTRGRQALYLDYEAYEEMAEAQMRQLATDACTRFGVRHVTMIHRLGRLTVGETSVLIVVASAHRAPAFEACRWLIDTLKKTVPIWKKETFQDGAVWAAGEPFPDGMAVMLPEVSHDV
jgi:molybdopterin synthase catalytic subunit/molybdopterin converting factor small subunit